MDTYTILLVCGIGLNVALVGGVIWLLRHVRRETERDLHRMLWPLADALMSLRDEAEDRV